MNSHDDTQSNWCQQYAVFDLVSFQAICLLIHLFLYRLQQCFFDGSANVTLFTCLIFILVAVDISFVQSHICRCHLLINFRSIEQRDNHNTQKVMSNLTDTLNVNSFQRWIFAQFYYTWTLADGYTPCPLVCVNCTVLIHMQKKIIHAARASFSLRVFCMWCNFVLWCFVVPFVHFREYACVRVCLIRRPFKFVAFSLCARNFNWNCCFNTMYSFVGVEFLVVIIVKTIILIKLLPLMRFSFFFFLFLWTVSSKQINWKCVRSSLAKKNQNK